MSDILDPRTGLPFAPSASGIGRLLACRGSWKKELPFIVAGESESSEDAEKGTRIHKWLELQIIGKQNEQELSETELDIANRCLEQQEAVIARNTPFLGLLTEQRLELWQGFQLLTSGQIDLLINCGSKLVIIDYKTGRNRIEADSPQMQSLAVLALHQLGNEKVNEIELVIIQPLCGAARSHTMTASEINDWYNVIIDPLAQAEHCDDLSPSEDACKHCRALATCEAARQEVLDLELVSDLVELDNISASLTAGEIGLIYRKIPLVKKVIAAIENEVFSQLCKDPASIEGLEIHIEKPRLSEVEKVWQRRWLEVNNQITESGRAKKGAVKLAEDAWQETAAMLVKTTTYERQSWIDARQALEAISASLTPEQLRAVAGKIVETK